MADEGYKEEVMESYRAFEGGAFYVWLTEDLARQVEYQRQKVLAAKSWEEYCEARARYQTAEMLYNKVMNPGPFFD